MKGPTITDLLSRSTAQDESSDDQDDSLSLRDLPLASPLHSSTAVDLPRPPTPNHSRPSSSSSSDFFFEFLVNHDDSVISPADDVIFRGRLLPYAPPLPRRSLSLSSDSQPKPQPAIRTSRSLNYRELRRNSCSKSEILPRNSSKGCRSCNSDQYKAAGGMKLPWNLLAFGRRIPGDMELKDIRSRQFRRNTAPAGPFPGDRCSSSVTYWRLLNVLSCKSYASVDVRKTAPFHV